MGAALEATALLPPEDLNRVGFRSHEGFRPEVPLGAEGRGAKRELQVERIGAVRLRRAVGTISSRTPMPSAKDCAMSTSMPEKLPAVGSRKENGFCSSVIPTRSNAALQDRIQIHERLCRNRDGR
jgi:hypothetical protein